MNECDAPTARGGGVVGARLSDPSALQRYADAFPSPVWSARADGTIDIVNSRLMCALGVGSDLATGGWSAMVHLDDRASWVSAWNRARATHASLDVTVRVWVAPSAGYRWVTLSAEPMVEHGQRRWLGAYRDVDDQHWSECARKLLLFAGAAIVDAAGVALKLDTMARACSTSLADVCVITMQRRDADAPPLRWVGSSAGGPDADLVDAVSRAVMRDAAGRGAPSGRSEIVDGLSTELAGLSEDERRKVRQWGRVSCLVAPVRGASGLRGSIALLTIEASGRRLGPRDIPIVEELARRACLAVEHVRHLDDLEFEKRKMRAIFERTPGAICTTAGPEDLVDAANSTFVALSRLPDPRGLPLRWLLGEMSSALPALFDRVRASATAEGSSEVVMKSPDGTRSEVFDVLLEPLARADEAVRGLVLFAVDTTQKTNAARDREVLIETLERQNRELDQFARVASHDLKTPLRGIASLTSWLEEDLGGELRADSLAHLRLLRGRVTRLDALVDGILRFAQAGRARGAESKVDLREIIEEVVELLAPPSSASVSIIGKMPGLRAERAALQQIFLNLIGNALKFADRPDPSIQVRAADVGGAVEITVADNGPGIPAVHHQRIFDLFDRASRRDADGLGIGLSVVKKVVEARGGRVFVTSPPEGGAMFHVWWPYERVSLSG